MGKDTLEDFADKTSCHGLSQIHSSTSRSRRIIWIISVLMVAGFLSYQLYTRITEYLKFQTTTKLSEDHVKYIEFPAVTICNFNPLFNVSEGEEMDSATILIRALKGRKPNSTEEAKLAYFSQTYRGSVRKYMKEKGWRIGKSLRWCRFENTVCSARNFTRSVTNMGLCWTFNTEVESLKPGSRSGLYFGVDIKEADTLDDENTTSWLTGIRVQVHPSYEEPQVDELGLAISGGKIAFISVHKHEVTHMPRPWGKCDKGKEELDNFETYTIINCYEDCYRGYLGESCQCILSDNVSVACTPEEEVGCWAEAAQARSFATTYDCPCQPACNSAFYRPTISTADLYSKNSEQTETPESDSDEAYSYYDYGEYNYDEEYYDEYYDDEEIDEKLSPSVIGIHVYFDGMSITKLEESEAITFSGFISDIGGQLGLWMGISVLTLIEVAQLFLDLFFGDSEKKVDPEKNPQDPAVPS